MNDRVAVMLRDWRIRNVLPHVRGRLLDIGCGTNALVRRYRGEGIGVDTYQWGDVDVVAEETSDLRFPSGSFDTVTIVAALNHIPNRDAVLAEAHRLLSAHGHLVVTMIPPRLSRVWHFVRRPWDDDQMQRGMKPGEVFGLTRRHVRRLLAEAGFEAITSRRFMLGVNTLTVARKKCPSGEVDCR